MSRRRKPTGHGAAALRQLKRELLADEAFKGQQIVIRSSEGKMSEVLLEFIEPFKKYATTMPAYERLIVLAILAWNAALLEGVERQELINKTDEIIIGQAGEEWRKDLDAILAMLIERKERYFADNKRRIIEYRLTDTGKNYHLAVVSTL
jgi:hypothetical protein